MGSVRGFGILLGAAYFDGVGDGFGFSLAVSIAFESKVTLPAKRKRLARYSVRTNTIVPTKTFTIKANMLEFFQL